MSQVQVLRHVNRTCRYIYRILALTEIVQSEDPTFEQKEWLEFRKIRPFPEPYKPWPKTKKEFKYKTFSFAEVLASVEPLEETD